MWSDPSHTLGWHSNADRNVSVTFGPDVLREFLQAYDLDLVCRAHMMVQDGYLFFANQQLVTVFSAPNYRDRDDEVVAVPNAAAILCVDRTLMCSFQILQPEKKREGGGAAGAGARPVEEAGARLVRWSNLEEAEVQRFHPSEYVTDAEFAIPKISPVDTKAAEDWCNVDLSGS